MKPFKSTFKSITEMFKQGINRIGQAFGMEGPGAMTWDTSGEFGFLKAGGSAEGAGRTLTEALGDFMQNTLNKVTGKPKVFKGVEVPTVPDPVATVTDNILDPQWTTPTGQTVSPGMDPTDPALLEPPVIEPIQVTAQKRGGEQTWLGDKLDDLGGLKKQVADTKIGNFATLGEVGTAGKTALTGYTVYSQFAPSDYESPFYNENIGMSNAMLTQTNQNAVGADELVFSGAPAQPTDNFNTLAEKYLTGFGYALPSAQTDPFNYAMQQPVYGYTFDNYLYDNVT